VRNPPILVTAAVLGATEHLREAVIFDGFAKLPQFVERI